MDEIKKEYKKKLNKQIRTTMLNPKNISENLENTIKLLEEMAEVGVITESQKDKHIARIYKEMNSPAEFREWITSRYDWLRKKLRR